ncbi:MAG TPA: F0F1 ATP synthase subunit A, partial [Acetobacteraceae bacterium]|nr:F0F1 ATP synthase subunit A [Acetobacteraceae bacterium]
MAAGGSIDALGQFQLHPALGRIGASVNFTQANLMMVVASVLVLGLLWLGMRPRAMVPGRLQSAAEMSYETVMNMCLETIGEEGRKYFPFVFTLFFFILFGNLLGVFPYFFTFTSHIAVTLALTVFVVGLVTFVAIRIHGWHFFSYFVPKGVPMALMPLLVPIEILSYVSRLISLSVR